MHDLSLPGNILGWLQLTLGLLLLWAPGFFIALRFSSTIRALLLGPIITFSVISPAALLANRFTGLPITTGSTISLLVLVAVWAAWPFIRRQKTITKPSRPGMKFLALCLPAILFVGLVQATPHLDGTPEQGAAAWGELGQRAWQGVSGDHEPAPIHVDAYYFASKSSHIARSGDASLTNQYTGDPDGREFFSVGGFRSEQGFAVALAQIHLVTGVAIPAVMKFLPAMWSMYQGALIAGIAYGRPGAALSPLAIAFIPNTARLLGAGYAVPSAFGTAWVWAIILLLQGARSPGRYLVVMAVLTGAFFQHLVPAVVTLMTAVVYTAWRNDDQRLGQAAALLVPLAWILPATSADAVAAVSDETTLPFDNDPFLAIFAVLLVAVPTVVWAARRRDTVLATLATIGLATASSMAVSVWLGHGSDATYTRIMYAACAALAATAILGTCALLAKYVDSSKLKPAITGLLLIFLLTPAIENATDSTPYRIYEKGDLPDVHDFSVSGAGPDDLFLSQPWRAPLLNAVTGAEPITVLYPGQQPENENIWLQYLDDGGNQTFFDFYAIDYIVGPVVPNATHEAVGANVYRLIR